MRCPRHKLDRNHIAETYIAIQKLKIFECLSAAMQVLEMAESDVGGFKLASANVAGRGAYGSLKWESGIHRVQRVPVTESSGRVHTSAASVAVMPQADEVRALTEMLLCL